MSNLSPREMEYLAHVIDTEEPMLAINEFGDITGPFNNKSTYDSTLSHIIAFKMNVTYCRVEDIKKKVLYKLKTKNEILKVCKEIMG